jgi:hypothetical protein
VVSENPIVVKFDLVRELAGMSVRGKMDLGLRGEEAKHLISAEWPQIIIERDCS